MRRYGDLSLGGVYPVIIWFVFTAAKSPTEVIWIPWNVSPNANLPTSFFPQSFRHIRAEKLWIISIWECEKAVSDLASWPPGERRFTKLGLVSRSLGVPLLHVVRMVSLYIGSFMAWKLQVETPKEEVKAKTAPDPVTQSCVAIHNCMYLVILCWYMLHHVATVLMGTWATWSISFFVA